MDKKFIIGGAVASLLAVGGTLGTVSAQTAATETGLSEEQIIEIAMTEFAGEVRDIELEDEDGTMIYEVEMVAEDRSKAELEIDANTGEVLSVENKEAKTCNKDRDA